MQEERAEIKRGSLGKKEELTHTNAEGEMQRRMVKSPCNRCTEKEALRNAHRGRPGRRLSERAPRPDPPAPKGEMHARSVPHSVLALTRAALVAAFSHQAPLALTVPP